MPEGRRWRDPAWRGAAESWIREQLAELGREVVAEIEQPHARPWSTVLRVPTGAGPVWFKANGPGTAYEPRLLAALGEWRRELVPAPLAVAADRGWSLLRDAGGPTLRVLLQRELDLRHWERLLVAYAELQRDLTGHVDELLALGVPDLRPAAIPDLFGRLLDDVAWLSVGTGEGPSEAEYAELRALQPAFAGWCAELDGLGVAPSLQHDDVHDGNVVVRDGGYVLFDWGDACVAHPFASLLVALRGVARRCGLDRDDPRLRRLRDAYLEPWTAEHDRATLGETAALATRIGVVGRALGWQRALLGADRAERNRYADAVGGWLAELVRAQSSG